MFRAAFTISSAKLATLWTYKSFPCFLSCIWNSREKVRNKTIVDSSTVLSKSILSIYCVGVLISVCDGKDGKDSVTRLITLSKFPINVALEQSEFWIRVVFVNWWLRIGEYWDYNNICMIHFDNHISAKDDGIRTFKRIQIPVQFNHLRERLIQSSWRFHREHLVSRIDILKQLQ